MSIFLIKYAIFAVFIYLLLRPGLKADRNWLLIEYSAFAKVFFMAMALSGFFIIYSASTAEDGPKQGVYLVLYSFVLLACAGTVEAFRSKLWFDNETLYFQPAFGRRVTMKISGINQCRAAWFGTCYKFKDDQGNKIVISNLMSGAADLYLLMRKYRAAEE